MNNLDISVIFATYNRGDILRTTLNSFTDLRPNNINYEIIVVDNACQTFTKELVESYRNKLPIRYLDESTPGKNSALITGLGAASGKLLVFTDDDVIADPEWLNELFQGVARHPEADLFGGKILPAYPLGYQEKTKDIDFTHWFLRSAYVIADWDHGEGEIAVGHIWGPNMAVRRRVFDAGITFNPNIGPNGKDYIMGSETEFLRRANSAGHNCIYLPQAVVYHQIREEQLNLKWLKGRAFRSGKGHAALRKPDVKITWGGVPRFLYKKYIILILRIIFSRFTNTIDFFDSVIESEIVRGQIHQYRKMHNE